LIDKIAKARWRILSGKGVFFKNLRLEKLLVSIILDFIYISLFYYFAKGLIIRWGLIEYYNYAMLIYILIIITIVEVWFYFMKTKSYKLIKEHIKNKRDKND